MGITTCQNCLFLFLFPIILVECTPFRIAYKVREEERIGTAVGNVLTDSDLGQKYNQSVLLKLRFSFLSQPTLPRSILEIDDHSSIIKTVSRIDRESICSLKAKCSLQYDVAVTPMKYFQIIKLIVHVLDMNDNSPSFSQASFKYTVLESAPPGHEIVLPTASDNDSQEFSITSYEILPNSNMFKLQVSNRQSGTMGVSLALINKLDREREDFYQFTLIAIDGGNPPESGSTLINITVIDVNDNNPVFEKSLYTVSIPEDIDIGTTVLEVKATDQDEGLYGTVLYDFSKDSLDSYGSMFGINNKTGELYVNGGLDFEKRNMYHLTVIAYDQGQDSLPARATITINLLDTNDHPPVIKVNTISGSSEAVIPENSIVGTFVAHVSAKDEDEGVNGQLACSLSHDLFMLEHLEDGAYQILTAGRLDREHTPAYRLTIKCNDFADIPLISTENITVIITDTNDNAPIFRESMYYFRIEENNNVSAFVGQVNASDPDEGANGEVIYTIQSDIHRIMSINMKTGAITANYVLNREKVQEMSFVVKAQDKGSPSLSGTATVLLTVDDKNDEIPLFVKSSYPFSLGENKPPGTIVGQVSAVDNDLEPYNDITYSLNPDTHDNILFTIDAKNGVLRSAKSIDREKNPVFYLSVIAMNRGYNGMSSSAKVSVYIADTNDNAPIFTYPTSYNNTVHMSSKVPLGHVFARARAKDKDIGVNSVITFAIQGGDYKSYFDIDPTNGAIRTKADLGKLRSSIITLVIRASDHGRPPKSTLQELNILLNKTASVASLEENPPSGGVLSKQNLTILITVSGISAFIALALVVVIVIIRRQGQVDDKKRFLARTEALRMLSGREDMNDLGAASDTGSIDSAEGQNKCGSDTVTYNLNQMDSGYHWQPDINTGDSVSWPANLNSRHPQVRIHHCIYHFFISFSSS